jgi:hypothetical protein
MNATNHHGAALARCQSGHQMDPRLAVRRLRNALHAVIVSDESVSGQRTPVPEHAWHDNTREQPRSALVCEKERAMLADAALQGCTTPDRIIEYFLVRIDDALAQFPSEYSARELVYLKLAIDEAEALEAQSIDRALPSPEHHRAALAATKHVALDAEVFLSIG